MFALLKINCLLSTSQVFLYSNLESGLKNNMSSGNCILHSFIYFQEREKVAKFFKTNYNKDMLEKELSLKGWNWGTAKFNGAVLSFNVGSNTAFEIPLHYVSQCNTGKNEVTLEFHQVNA